MLSASIVYFQGKKIANKYIFSHSFLILHILYTLIAFIYQYWKQSWKSFHSDIWGMSSFFFTAKNNPLVCTIIYSTHFLAIGHYNISKFVLLWVIWQWIPLYTMAFCMLIYPQDTFPEIELQGQKPCAYVFLIDTPKMTYIDYFLTKYMPTSNVWDCFFPLTLSSTVDYETFWSLPIW